MTTSTTTRIPRVVHTLWESADQFVAVEILDDGHTRFRTGHPRWNRSYHPLTSDDMARLADALKREEKA